MMIISNVKLEERLSEDSKTILRDIVYCADKMGIASKELADALHEYVVRKEEINER